MTVEWYDLAQRLHAAQTGVPVARLAHAPLLPVAHPVAVRAWQNGRTTTVAATVPGVPVVTTSGSEGLDLLHGLGVRISADAWATLVTDDEATLPTLLDLAHGTDLDGAHADTAAHIGWWAERADFPGSTGVVPLVALCRDRWITGSTPLAEGSAKTWRQWLGVRGDDCTTLLDMLALVGRGVRLPGLEAIAIDDAWSWRFAQREHADGLDWRAPDSLSRAATGLRARCDAAELYDAALLNDPLWCRRAVHTGHVTTGHVIARIPGIPGAPSSALGVVCDRFATRLRPGNAVVGWAGGPQDSQTEGRFTGTLLDTVVVGGVLVLVLSVAAARRPEPATHVSVRSAPPSADAKRAGLTRYRRLYSARRSWLTTGRAPVTCRRDVPLDVVFAATE